MGSNVLGAGIWKICSRRRLSKMITNMLTNSSHRLKWLRMIHINTNHIVLFQIFIIRSTNWYFWLANEQYRVHQRSIQEANSEPYGQLDINSDLTTSDAIKFCSNILSHSPTTSHCRSSLAKETPLTSDHQNVAYSEESLNVTDFQKIWISVTMLRSSYWASAPWRYSIERLVWPWTI